MNQNLLKSILDQGFGKLHTNVTVHISKAYLEVGDISEFQNTGFSARNLHVSIFAPVPPDFMHKNYNLFLQIYFTSKVVYSEAI